MQKGFISVIAGLVIATIIGLGFGSYLVGEQQEVAVGGDSIRFVSGHTYNLSGSGVSSSASSVGLTSLTIKQTGQEVQTSDIGDIAYGTIEPGNTTRQECVSFTGITQNSDGSATLTGVSRGLSPVTPYTASSTLQFAHAGGSRFIISDCSPFLDESAFKDNDETITGLWTFDADRAPVLDAATTATTSEQLVTKRYVDNLTNQGAATSSESVGGISELATQLEMASSTDKGANDPLVIQAKYSTSSPDLSTGGDHNLYNVVSENDGKINQDWIDLDEAFAFASTSATTFQSTNATTSNLGVKSKHVSVNNIDYNFPASETASSTVLTTNGSGELRWMTPRYTVISDVVTASASSTITIKDLTASNEMHFVFYTPGKSGAEPVRLQFNLDPNALYGGNRVVDGAVSAKANSVTSLQLSSATTSAEMIVGDIYGLATVGKLITWQTAVTATESGNAPEITNGSGAWSNATSTINKITFTTAAADTMDTGTRITIYAKAE